MFLTIVFGITLLQLLGYCIVDSQRMRISTLWVLLFVMLIYGIALPYTLYQIQFADEPEGPRCGLPVLGMYGACWIFGGGSALFTHLCYRLVRGALRNG
ncbi:hypothetical protein [Flavobacterium sp.]|uniref:hypothetical protein n=1 Tax=Flavobacterium sp. TaxID=239 RepID=UPI00260F48C4|nr:hypothetical protein [Flavobacterium sp.]